MFPKKLVPFVVVLADEFPFYRTIIMQITRYQYIFYILYIIQGHGNNKSLIKTLKTHPGSTHRTYYCTQIKGLDPNLAGNF